MIEMIKGCQRRIIMVKDTGSKYFDTAYFVMRSDLDAKVNETDMINEAGRMIEGCITDRGAALQKRSGYGIKPLVIVSAAIAVLSVSAAVIAAVL